MLNINSYLLTHWIVIFINSFLPIHSIVIFICTVVTFCFGSYSKKFIDDGRAVKRYAVYFFVMTVLAILCLIVHSLGLSDVFFSSFFSSDGWFRYSYMLISIICTASALPFLMYGLIKGKLIFIDVSEKLFIVTTIILLVNFL